MFSIHQVIGFAAIWTSPRHQKLVAEACVPSRDLTPASFEVLMPIYGTFDDFVEDLKKWRTRPAQKTAPPKQVRPKPEANRRTGSG